LLPTGFYGPYYFHYEEGAIISFTSSDTCIVSILCGANAILNLDSTYERIDTLKESLNQRHLLFYSSIKNRFARQNFMKRYFIMYENASKCRKEDLDRTFDSLMKE
jgi:cellulose biosynthesis protein BcsQ